MKRNLIILAAIVIVLVAGFGVYKMNKDKGYSIVYLTTGEVYIGKLSTFPSLEIKDAYILQVTKDTTDPTKNNFQLQPIKDALWAPESLRLMEKNVVFYGPLMSESAIAKKLAEQVK